MKKLLIFVLLIAFSFHLYAQKSQVKHVILIGVDGLGAYSFPKADIPNLQMMMENGSWSLKARAVLPSSSAVNWASMTMGAGPELHGYTEWGSQSPELPSRKLDKYGMFPSIFSLLREQKPDSEIGVIYEWEGIGYLFPKEAIDERKHLKGDSATAATAIRYIKESKPNLLFVHFSEVDNIGHGIGHGTPEYYAQVHKVDALIGKIIASIKEAGILDESVIIVSSDHGGIEKGHGGKTMQEMEIPWIIMGKSISKNHEVEESIMTYDTAATIAYLLKLSVPQSWIGRPVMDALIKKNSVKSFKSLN
jgi:predicted AlkP superfamily pyrophosphatase or phosphodiesterase